MCGADVLIYEWKESIFAELTRGEVGFSECNDFPTFWHNGAPIEDGLETIDVVDFNEDLLERFQWNGEFYERSEYHPHDSRTIFGINDWDLEAGKLEARIEEYQTFLDLWPALDAETLDYLGAAYPDYVRFQMGLAQALNSEPVTARATLDLLAKSPTDPSKRLVSEAASAFLQVYSGDSSLYNACLVANKVAGDLEDLEAL